MGLEDSETRLPLSLTVDKEERWETRTFPSKKRDRDVDRAESWVGLVGGRACG